VDRTFEQFVADESVSLLRLAWTLTADRHAAEDLVQDTLLVVYRKWRRVSATQSPGAYTRRILINRFKDRRPLRETVVEDVPEAAGTVASDLAVRSVLVRALAELSAQQRKIVALRYVDDQSITDTAELVGCSPTTVTTQASRALAALRRWPELRELFGKEEPCLTPSTT
jgi:RNA polymerase sigma-70 factor (sigma-E family)